MRVYLVSFWSSIREYTFGIEGSVGNNKIKFVTLNEDRPRKVFYEKKKKGKNFLPGVD